MTETELEVKTQPKLRNESFSLEIPTLQVAWDSTSLGLLKACPQKYKYSIVDGFQPTGSSVHLEFGSLIHSALEFYDKTKLNGLDHDQAVLATIKYALVSTWDFQAKRPWISMDPAKNRLGLIRTIVWYLEQFEHDIVKTVILANGKPAVEYSFKLDIDIASGISSDAYLICGHIDRLVEFENEIWVMDRKTTGQALEDKYFDQFTLDNQMTLYAYAGQVIYANRPVKGIIIDGMQVGATYTRARRFPFVLNQGYLNDWINHLQVWLHTAELYSALNFWPKNEKSCNDYGGCPFRRVCAASPESRPELLAKFYTRRVWDPMQAR